MADSVRIQDSLAVRNGASSSKQKDPVKGAASAISLAEIEQLFEILNEQQSEKSKEDLTDSEKQLLGLISSLLSGMEDGKVDGKTMSTMQGYVSDFYKGDATALGKILAVVMPALQLYVQKHPKDLMGAIKAFAPLMKQSGEEVMGKLKVADKCFELFQAGYAKSTDPNKGEKLAEALGQLFDKEKISDVDDAMDLLEEEFEELLKQDNGKGQSIISAVYTMVSTYALSGGGAAKSLAEALLNAGALKNLMNLSSEKLAGALAQLTTLTNKLAEGKIGADEAAKTMNIIINPSNSASGGSAAYYSDATHKVKQHEANLRDILANAMMSLQLLQGALTQAQAQQTEFTMAIDQAKIDAAVQRAVENLKKIDEEIELQKKADDDGGWLGWLIKAIMAVVAVIVAAVTAGVGAAIAAALIGVFMSTPLMNMTVKAIADKISADVYDKYYKEYKAEGKSDSEAKALAQQKADAVGNLVAQIIVVVAVVILSFGAGGFQAGEGAAEDGAEEASMLSKLKWNSSLATKVSVFEGLSAVGSTNVWMTAMETDPEWCKDHMKLMVAIDIIAEIITMIAALVAGGAATKEAQAGVNASLMPEKIAAMFAKNAKYILSFYAGMQMLNSGYDAYTSSRNAEYLHEAADLMKEIGELTASISRTNGMVDILQATQKSLNKETAQMVKSDGDTKDSIADGAGLEGDAVFRALMGA